MLYYEIDTKYYSAPKPTKTIFKVIGSISQIEYIARNLCTIKTKAKT